LEPAVLDYIQGNNEPFEAGALPRLAEKGELMCHKYNEFWQTIDTVREKQILQEFAAQETPPWLSGITKR
jgi:glucose-1-phosphate cytidylyltransferase